MTIDDKNARIFPVLQQNGFGESHADNLAICSEAIRAVLLGDLLDDAGNRDDNGIADCLFFGEQPSFQLLKRWRKSLGRTLALLEQNGFNESSEHQVEELERKLADSTVALYKGLQLLDEMRKQNKVLIELVQEMAEHSTYETEYDGRMYEICHGCGAQDD